MSFRDFCATLYKEEYDAEIPEWQLEMLDWCYNNRDIALSPMRGDGKSMTKLMILTLIMMYDEMEEKLDEQRIY